MSFTLSGISLLLHRKELWKAPLNFCKQSKSYPFLWVNQTLFCVNMNHTDCHCLYTELSHSPDCEFLADKIMSWRLLSIPPKMSVELLVATDKTEDPHWYLHNFLKFKLKWKIKCCSTHHQQDTEYEFGLSGHFTYMTSLVYHFSVPWKQQQQQQQTTPKLHG